MLWSEKYRPKTPLDLDCQPFIKSFLLASLKDGFPHLLLYGPPGTGKTSFATLLNPTLQLNASDERGIDVIRNKIKKVANTVTPQTILLDECENLTRDSQTCLRRILEDFPNTRFIFCTNYHSRIIDPLKSRLLKLKFVPQKNATLEKVAIQEGMKEDSEFYQAVFKKCNGDLRRSLNVLQGLKPLISNNSNKLELIDELVGLVREDVVREFKSITAKNYRDFVRKFIFEGYSVIQLIYQLTDSLLEVGNDTRKCYLAKILAEAEGKAIVGCSEEIVLAFLCVNYIE